MIRTALVALALSVCLAGCKHAPPAETKTAPALHGMTGNGVVHVVKASGEEVRGLAVEVRDPDFTILEVDGTSTKVPMSRVHMVSATGQTAQITPKSAPAAGGAYSVWEIEKTDGTKLNNAIFTWPQFAVDVGGGNVDRRPLFTEPLRFVEAP